MGQSCSVSAKESADSLECSALPHKCAAIEQGVKHVTKSCEVKPSSNEDKTSLVHKQQEFHAAYKHKHGKHLKGSNSSASFSSTNSTTSTCATSDYPSMQSSFSENSNGSDSLCRFKSASTSLLGSAPSVRCSTCAHENQDTPTTSPTGSLTNSLNLVSWCGTVNISMNDGERPSYKLADAQSKSAPGFLERESLRSATLSANGGTIAQKCTDDKEGDCLPPDGIVWVEGQNRPQPLGTVTAGQRVLCHDMAFGGFKYAPVTDARVEEQGEVDWVEIVLQDGTTLPMTADHPMKAEGPGNPVRAADIKPQQDSIMVLKLVPVPVERVSKCIGLGSKRASVAVAQPSRHTLLVGNSEKSELMTVGSVDLGEIPRLKEELTFLDLQEGKCERAKRRANSEPLISFEVPSSSNTTTDTPDSERASLSESHSDSATETSDSVEEGEDTDMVLVGTNLEGDASNTIVKLSDLLDIKAKGLKSHGSQSHAARQCRVCVFENRFFHDGGNPCFKGRLCEYCHDYHARSSRLKKRGTRAGHKMDKRSQPNHFP